MLGPGVADALEGGVVERSRKIDAMDIGAQGATCGLDPDRSHGVSPWFDAQFIAVIMITT